jgi:hypothetical protein
VRFELGEHQARDHRQRRDRERFEPGAEACYSSNISSIQCSAQVGAGAAQPQRGLELGSDEIP